MLKPGLFARLVRTAGRGRTKMDAQATYGLCFGRSRYAWKAKEINFPIQLESRPDSLGVLTGTAETIGRPESTTIIRHVSADIWKLHEDLGRWREESRSCYLIFESLLSCNLSLVFV